MTFSEGSPKMDPPCFKATIEEATQRLRSRRTSSYLADAKELIGEGVDALAQQHPRSAGGQ